MIGRDKTVDTFSRFTELAESLPPTVPFVGPETQERAAGKSYIARLGAMNLDLGLHLRL